MKKSYHRYSKRLARHGYGECPVYNAICRACRKRGHYELACVANKVKEVIQDDRNSEKDEKLNNISAEVHNLCVYGMYLIDKEATDYSYYTNC